MSSKARWGWWVLAIVAWAIIGVQLVNVIRPFFTDVTTYGSHDWDVMEAHRYVVTKTVAEYLQFPFWNPYSCGGHSAWGGFESGPNLVSLWLPAYLFLDLPLALRIEVVGTAVLSAIGCWLLAGRFTRSVALRALVCVIFVVNGRWALQISTGHMMHLYYCWTPWALFFFDRACDPDLDDSRKRLRDIALVGAFLALMVYNGGIYPLPHTLVALAIFAAVLATRLRSTRPLWMAAAAMALSGALAAPKLLPLLDVMAEYPRHVTSNEKMDLYGFVQGFTARNQDLGSRPAPVSRWGWHEWGIYIGWAGFLVISAGAVFPKSARASALRWAGVALMVLGFGSFHEYAPWRLLHDHVPIFKSQHVPSRWQYPAVLLLGVAAVAWAEGWLRRLGDRRIAAEPFLLAGVALVGYDVATVAYLPMRHAFGRDLPKTVEYEAKEFRLEHKVPAELHWAVKDWAPPALPAMIANVGTVECGTFHGFHSIKRDLNGRLPGLGARGKGHPDYRGETFVLDGPGKARLARFTPNAFTVEVEGTRPGDVLVLNQNWDPGWSASPGDAFNHEDTVAVRTVAGATRYEFDYTPRTWWLGLLVFFGTLGGLAVRWRRLPPSTSA